jgi:catechol 2,3-dioxygenase-like lactoylglutathione lyase family enzyme
MFLGLRTVIYAAPDLAAAREWWTRALGFPPYFDQPFYVGFNVAGYELGLDPNAPPATANGGATGYWGVPEIHAAHQRLLALGALTITEVTEVGDGIKVATLRDPWGNVVGLIENPHFKLPG